MLNIRIKKISPTHHQFKYRRADNTGESLELETKTFLYHDFLHFAVESEAHLENSFYGQLVKRKNYAALTEPMNGELNFSTEIVVTERVVGALTGALKSSSSFEQMYSSMKNMFDAYGEPVPKWLTERFFVNVKERMRHLLGQWSATKFGEIMELQFT
jgi:hypothetical protein